MEVKEVGSVEEKSIQEREEQILETAQSEEQPQEEVAQEEVQPEAEPEINDDLVLSHIRKRYNKEINSLDELLEERQQSEELPEDVQAYYKYRKETGRGLQDYMKVQRNFDDIGDDQLLVEYYKLTQDGLDDEDYQLLLEEFSYDEDVDSETDVRKKKLAKKKEIATARKYLKEQQEKYKAPLESSGSSIPDADKDAFESYKQYLQESTTVREQNAKKSEWFEKKTNELFNQEFKGFEFKVGDKSFNVSLGDAQEIKKQNATPMNLIGKFLDDNGFLKDAAGYHRALAIAMNPEKFAEFFYEQGKSSATEDVTKRIKNIDMSERSVPEATKKGGMQVKALSQDSGRGRKIKRKP